ncbi:MAG: hypothetical protein V7L11_04630, partial [Nostoc sp.]|uniref:hypothetical protein n=1 Tax=Nostoc sp. TaxID=1180 RepID=UPI002FF648F2
SEEKRPLYFRPLPSKESRSRFRRSQKLIAKLPFHQSPTYRKPFPCKQPKLTTLKQVLQPFYLNFGKIS